ncbi:DNA adenine methylase [Pedobacter insulae]|uniref:site-specific DNA-methyltransferase (adenine-specific) n=1 Tax=Pedobacter insulae TaxID=414048 RepID=A0A1I2UPC5_9SPHI|nr:DNA adenine methylase [Pedobacter insulae]SFG76716.1 DNA adenine methylase [Pedobacter insulae]
MKKKLRPLLKWTGGKFDEYILFEKYVPGFERYIEPFFGGGGVFFALQPKGAILINDKSTDLINFYRQINQVEFKTALLLYADMWDELEKLASFLWGDCAGAFSKYITHKVELTQLIKGLEHSLNLYLKNKSLLKDEHFILDFDLFKKMLLDSLVDKAKRIKTISAKENRHFTKIELFSHFETGIRGGIYLFFRKILNLHAQKGIQLSAARAAANWYFIREFCYAAMFRFNARGEFNIPYGGITYNKKKFRGKIERIFTDEVAKLFGKSVFSNEDFEYFLNNSNLNERDFIFVDPPYDTEFSEYDRSAFTQKDQERLASFLIKTPAKWMLVIKETSFIRNLYSRPNINIKVFEKNYAYNVRGRNKRGVTHLIIMNY